MNKHFGNTILILGAGFALALSACQTQPGAGSTPTPRPLPTTPAPLERNLTVLWTLQTGAAIWGSPALEAGVVYIGSDDGKLYAVSAENGQPLWEFVTKGIIRSRPALGGGLVYISSDDGFLYAVDAKDGQQAWSADIGNFLEQQERVDLGTSTAPTGFDYFQSSPVVAGDLVYVGSFDGNVYALSAKEGQLAWKFATGDKVRASPTVDDGTLYIGSWDKFFYAIDAQSGKMLWKTNLNGQVQSDALVAKGKVYCASREASVYALDAQTGEVKWSYSYGKNMWVESSPLLVDGTIYIGSSGNRAVYGLQSENGTVRTMFSSSAFHWSTPLQVNDAVYIGGVGFQDPENSGLYALTLEGQKLPVHKADWRLLPVKNTLEFSGDWAGVAGSPIESGDVIYFGALDGNLYAVKDQ